ncbi:MAG: J domain-containing protein [Dehalococcoidia bacterium]
MRDPFEVLGLPSSATRDEVRARYRELARQHHPDAGGGTERMAEINSAYDLLARDLEGCRRRRVEVKAKARTANEPSPSRARTRTQTTSRPRPRSTPAPTKQEGRTIQWKDWLARARTVASGKHERPAASAKPAAIKLEISPSILALCRFHGPQTLKVSGADAEGARLVFPTTHMDVTRGPGLPGEQRFSVRLKGSLPGPEGSVFVVVRAPDGGSRRIPVYEFSCPSNEGSCAFAS